MLASFRSPTLLLLTIFATAAHSLAAVEFSVDPMFSSHMVIQRELPVRVFGRGPEDGRVSVSIGDERATGTITDGRWELELPPVPTGGPYVVDISGPGGEKRELTDVLCGDVWICAGQSNMRRPLSAGPELSSDQTLFENPAVRLMQSAIRPTREPATELERDAGFENGWQIAAGDVLPRFSATGYFFGLQMQQQMDIPIGLVNVARGATRIEGWLDAKKLSELAPEVRPTTALGDHANVTVFYNGMIAPIQRFPIKGVIWYQGESNARSAANYELLFRGLIRRWREQWDQGNFPFYWVQLASFGGGRAGDWPAVRHAQSLVRSEPHTGMAVAIDLGEFQDIHPQHKRPIAWRLAAVALAGEGYEVPSVGPQMTRVEFRGDTVRIQFSHVADGLEIREVTMTKTRGLTPTTDPEAIHSTAGRLVGFETAGPDGTFQPAEATVHGDTVVLKIDPVSPPTTIRYAWRNFIAANLFNSDGLPAEPFQFTQGTAPNESID